MPDCQSPARLHGFSGALWDADASDEEGVVVTQFEMDTILTRVSPLGLRLNNPVVIGTDLGVVDLDLLLDQEFLVAYEVGGATPGAFLSFGGNLGPGDIPLESGSAPGRTPRIVRAEDSIVVGHFEETSELRFSSFTLNGTLELATRSAPPGESPYTLRDWAFDVPRGSLYGLAAAEVDRIVIFGRDAGVGGIHQLPVQGLSLIETPEGTLLVGLNEIFNRIELTPFDGSAPDAPMGKVTLDEGLTGFGCSILRMAPGGDTFAAAARCSDGAESHLRAVLLSADPQDDAGAVVDVLADPREVLDHRLLRQGEQFWSVWMEPSGLWIAPICFP